MTTPVAPGFTSPDLSQYVDLTLYDADAQMLLQQAVTLALTTLPTWAIGSDPIGAALMETLCTIVGELILRVNRIPGADVESLLGLFNVQRSGGTAPTAVMQVQMVDTNARVLPAGTRVGFDLAGTPFTFTTTEDLAIPAGSDTGTVVIEGDSLTDQLNGTAAGTVMQLIDSVSWVERMTLVTAVTGGAGPETSESLLDRGVEVFKTLSSALSMPDHFTAAALATAGVFRAIAVNDYDPTTGHAVGTDAGHVTIAVLGTGGSLMTTQAKADLQAALAARTTARLAVHVIDPTMSPVNVTVTVKAIAGADKVATRQSVIATLTNYLSPSSWSWGGVVRVNELITLISNVEGVDYVVGNLGAPAADVTLTGAAPLPTAGTLTVTVT